MCLPSLIINRVLQWEKMLPDIRGSFASTTCLTGKQTRWRARFPAQVPPCTGFQYNFYNTFFLPWRRVNTQLLPGEAWCRGSIASSNPISTTQWVTLDTLLDLLSCFSAHKLGAKGTLLLKSTSMGLGELGMRQ